MPKVKRMYKAGASNPDKNRIKRLHMEGASISKIVHLTKVKPEHVEAIIAQVEDGTLRLNGPAGGPASTMGDIPQEGIEAGD